MHLLLRYLRRTDYSPEEGLPTDGQLLERFLAKLNAMAALCTVAAVAISVGR
jgi:hypothetical protein